MRLVFLFEFLLLFFFSRTLTSSLASFFYSIFRSNRIAIILMAVIFLPGTIVHEMSHFIAAKILFVYAGKIELIPKLTDQTLKLGSVQIGKTDIVRNFIIGIAPFLIGSSLLMLLMYFSLQRKILGFNFASFLVLYIIFVVSNTMYSSRKDMEGALEFLCLVVVPVIVLYFIGVRIPGLNLNFLGNQPTEKFFYMASIFLAVPLLLDFSIILFVKIIMRR